MLLVLGFMIWDTFRSRSTLAEALSEPLSAAGLAAPRLREYVARAIEYRQQVRAALLARDPDSADLGMVEDAAVLVGRLCRTVDRYERDRLLARDIQRLERAPQRTAAEEEQLRTLLSVRQQMQEAERQAVDLLATLGESYASLRHLEAIPDTDGRAPDLLGRLRSESLRLRDMVQALEEVYQQRRASGTEGA